MKKPGSIFLFFQLFLLSVSGQTTVLPVQSPAQATDTIRIIEILYADKQGYKKVDSFTELQFIVGHVKIKQGDTYFYFDSSVYNRNLRMLEAFGNVHINDNDSVHTYAQYLQYFTDTRIAFLKKKVRLTDNKATLYSEDLQYDLNTKIGEYHEGGKLVNRNSVLTSKEATYYADLNEAYFRGQVQLKDPQYTLETDSLQYNTTSELTTFIAPTTIIDSSNRKILTREGTYDLKKKKAFLTSRSTIQDGAVTISANQIQSNDSTGWNLLTGNAVYKDTAEGLAVLANRIEANNKEDNFTATEYPLMILKQEEDSIFIAADTLYSGKLSMLLKKDSTTGNTDSSALLEQSELTDKNMNDSTDRYFRAYRNVRIFSDSLQAVSDSLFYSLADSVFRLFTGPIVWSSENQVTGDTIFLYTKNKKADRLYVAENGVMANKTSEEMFNQIKGNRINGYFRDGSLDYVRAKGNAESIYYIRDEDSSFVGINKARGDIIDLRFINKQVDRVVFVNEVKGTMYPLREFPSSESLLQGFQWQEKRRPKSKFSLLANEEQVK